MIDRPVNNLYGLPEFTHGEFFFLAKQNVRLDFDPEENCSKEPYPRKLPKRLKCLYYNAKLKAVFKELGYYSEESEWDISDNYKQVREYVKHELRTIMAARTAYLRKKRREHAKRRAKENA